MYFFGVLILKNVIYYKPSIVVLLKEFKWMCMLYILVPHGLKYMNTLMNLLISAHMLIHSVFLFL
jgi:hypothetical protein